MATAGGNRKPEGITRGEWIYNMTESPSEEDYLELAVETGLITEEILDEGVQQEQAIDILLRAQNLYYTELWRDDYVDIRYRQNVLEMKPESILSIIEDYSEMLVEKSVLQEIHEDTGVILPESVAGERLARKG